ncbi:MAG: hypothetical protein LUG93_07580 [Lachnospiraceae bacterium]|nr:hypothetical protein [Lachnospiraceae bacterium]
MDEVCADSWNFCSSIKMTISFSFLIPRSLFVTNDEVKEKTWLEKLLCGGENIFLTSEAGTGKSFLLRCFLDVKKKAEDKSQRQTYDSANLDPACFGEGQLYVALSRVASSDVLHLIRPIQKQDLKVSHDVTAFYESLLTNRVPDR